MRDITQCHPKLQKLCDELKTACERKGLRIGISECLRTKAEQDALYAQGRTKPGNKVTNARGSSYSSMHQWGVAFDIFRNDGKGAYTDNDGFFSKVGAIGVTLGLEWGGNWKSIVDKPHFQLPDWGSTAIKLKQLYGTPEKFFATWKDYKAPTPVDPITEKYGEKLEEKKTFKVTEESYIRETPGGNKIKYAKLDDTTKKKCAKGENDYAKILVGKSLSAFASTQAVRVILGIRLLKVCGFWLRIIVARSIAQL